MATKQVELPPLPERMSKERLDAHEADMKRRKAEQDARQEEMIKCCNPKYAARKEAEKPRYRFTVQAEWFSIDDGEQLKFDSTQVVVAQNEAEAWSMFCDKIGRYPSPRQAKRTITRGREVTVAESVTDSVGDDEQEIPRKTIGPKSKPQKL